MRNNNLNWRINHQIRSPQLRVVGPDGKQIGVLSLNEAITKAHDMDLDLIEIAPKANPPVARIMEFGKFKYQEEKRKQKEKKGAKGSEIKEVRFSPFIAPHDFETRMLRIDEFFKENNKVRCVVVFTFKQLGSKQFGYDILKKVLNYFKDRAVADSEPKFVGRNLFMIISPTKKVIRS